MNRSVLNIANYTRQDDIFLEKILSLTVVNSGEKTVEINGVVLKKNEQFDFIKPDGTISDFVLSPKYLSGKDVFSEPEGTISFVDLEANEAVFVDDIFNSSMQRYVIRSRFGFRELFGLVGLDDESPLNVPFIILQRQDKKYFLFVQHKTEANFYFISKYFQNTYFDDKDKITFQPLSFNYQNYSDFSNKQITVISKKLI